MKRDLPISFAPDDVITFGSVCSGIEAASVAWHDLGWRAAWLAEIEAYPRALLAHHYPDVPNLGNMLLIPALLRNGDIPAPDVFTGGTPCQAFSIAGLRNSLGDARGNLSLTFCEIADEIDIQRAANGLLPCVIKWENVPGVLTTDDNAFGCFLAGLAGEDEALVPEPRPAAGKAGKFWKWNKKTSQHTLSWPKSGCVIGPQRAVAWRVLDAQYHGLAQRRNRVFVVASAREGFDPVAVLFEFDGVRRDTPPSRESREDITHDLAPCLTSSGRGIERTGDTRGQDPVVACFGGGNTSGALQVAACLTAKGQRIDFEVETFAVQPIAFDSRQDCVSSTEVFGSLGSSTPQAQAVSYPVDVCPTLQAGGNGTGGERPPGTTVDTCHSLIPVCVTGDITHTLKAEGFDASEDGTGQGQPIVATAGAMCAHVYSGGMGGRVDMAAQGYVQPIGMAVRRLLPVECEALQGFPRGYTDIPFRGKPTADGPRYKALGNSWAVPVVRRLGARINAQLRAGVLA